MKDMSEGLFYILLCVQAVLLDIRCGSLTFCTLKFPIMGINKWFGYTGELRYDGPLYNGFLHMADKMLGPSPMDIKYSSYVYNRFCI